MPRIRLDPSLEEALVSSSSFGIPGLDVTGLLGTVVTGLRSVEGVFRLGRIAQRLGKRLVKVDTEKVVEAARRQIGLFVGPEGAGGIAKRYQAARQLLEQGILVDAPEIVVRKTKLGPEVTFVDGRHRFAAARDLGATVLNVAVPRQQVSLAERLLGPK